MNLTFLNAAMLYSGLALATIPIIIHLLYRRRFRRIDWAPMHYLKLSIQRNRRRIRIEQLLLLLVRTLAVLLLFCLVARPVLHAAGLGGWLTGSSRSSQLLVVDDSLSMGYLDGGRSAWQRATALTGEIARTMAAKDRVTLVLASQPKSPLLREVELSDPQDIARALADLRPSDALVAWSTTLESIDELLATATYPIQDVTILTDLRRAGWDDTSTAHAARLAERRVRMRLFDLGCDRSENIVLSDLRPLDHIVLAGNPLPLEATVRNDSGRQLDALEANLIVDGKPSLVRLPALGPATTVRVPLSANLAAAGPHHVALELPADELTADNRRWTVVNAREQVDLLLVDGEPSSEPLAGEVDFLALALSLGIGPTDAFHLDIVTDAEWSPQAGQVADLVVLANVANVTSEQVERLQRQVAAGVGLMIFVGDQVDAANFNQLLYRDGAGLSPAALETIADEPVSGLLVEPGPGALDALVQLNPAVLERIKVRRHYGVQMAAQADARQRVLARWNTTDAAPAVIEKRYGDGRVLLWTLSADKAWSDWPTEPSYVLAVREASRAIARGDTENRSLTAGEPLQWTLPPRKRAVSATVEPPEADQPQPLDLENVGQSPGDDTLQRLSYADTRRAGLYRLAWQDAAAGSQGTLVAVNPDVRESDLDRIKPDDLRRLWGGLPIEIIAAATDGSAVLAVEGHEIWRSLALGLLGLLIVESTLATWTGRQR